METGVNWSGYYKGYGLGCSGCKTTLEKGTPKKGEKQS